MARYLRPAPIIACVIMICLAVFVLRACDSCDLNHSPMYIPPWVNYPIKFRHIKGWVYKFHCPESWPWSKNRKTIIGLAIVNREDEFLLDWHIFEMVGGIIEEKVKWEDFGRFKVVFIEEGNPNSKHPYDEKLIEVGSRTVLILDFAYGNNEGKFKLNQALKGLNDTVKMIEELPRNWSTPIKGTRARPHLLDK